MDVTVADVVNFLEVGTGHDEVRIHGAVGRTGDAFEDARREQKLGAVAEGRDGFFLVVEVPNDVQDLLIQPKILRSPATGDKEA